MFAIDLFGCLVLGGIELVHRYFYPDQYKPEPPPPPKEDENVANTTPLKLPTAHQNKNSVIEVPAGAHPADHPLTSASCGRPG